MSRGWYGLENLLGIGFPLDPGSVLSLQALDVYPVQRHPGPPDTPVCGPYQSDGDPTLDLSARL